MVSQKECISKGKPLKLNFLWDWFHFLVAFLCSTYGFLKGILYGKFAQGIGELSCIIEWKVFQVKWIGENRIKFSEKQLERFNEILKFWFMLPMVLFAKYPITYCYFCLFSCLFLRINCYWLLWNDLKFSTVCHVTYSSTNVIAERFHGKNT